jgi:hypothetical protein
LTPERIATHPSLVICTDCVTDPNQLGYGPQKYNLVMLVCRKKSAKPSNFIAPRTRLL